MQHVVGTTPTPLTNSNYNQFNSSWWSVTSCGSQNPCGASRTNANPNSYAPFAYDAVFVAAKGIAVAGTVDHTETPTLLNALYNVSFTGASGAIKFNSKGEVNGRFDYVTLIDNNYKTFGKWNGTTYFYTTNVTLSNNNVYSLNNTIIIPTTTTTKTTTISPSTTTPISTTTSVSNVSTTKSTITTTPYSDLMYALVLPMVLFIRKRKLDKK